MNAEFQRARDVWHTQEVHEILENLQVEPSQGLSTKEAARRFEMVGANEIIERGIKSPLLILAEQFTESMVLVLLAAALVSAVIGDLKDMIAILAIVFLNAVLGFVQEYRSERAMAALKRMAAPVVKTRREGRIQRIEGRKLVPGDIILLESGDAIPADARVIEATSLRVQEASLTGESVPVDKSIEALESELAPMGDRTNMLFMGTAVTYGRGTAVIVETGMRTELGRIAELLQTVETEQTPLQRRMARLGRNLAFAALGIVIVVFVLGLLRGEDAGEMFLTAVALAVAAVPEGLPAVVTIALALGAQRLLRRGALIRKLPAVETLGSVTVICSDKTGTLTENRMTVRILDVAERTMDLKHTLRDGMPVLGATDRRIQPTSMAQKLLLIGGSLCNDAVIEEDESHRGDFITVGDPTEGALLIAAAKHDLLKRDLERSLPRVFEIPFSSERKRMTTVHHLSPEDGIGTIEREIAEVFGGEWVQYLAFTKGAVDGLTALSDRVWVQGQIRPLDLVWRQRIEEANAGMAQEGLRVLGLALKPMRDPPDEADRDRLEEALVFVGMVGMLDPPRPEVHEAVATSRAAGIRPVMITGDHPLTAQRIAKDLGIAGDAQTLTGEQLASIPLETLQEMVEDVPVYARVSPEHKLNIVHALQARGHIVAMTGDGVNDAPALRRSDIGVAMGITGTDVAKEAADMVVLDDNFATIVRAVREGRTIYDNVRKFIKYTLTSNAGEILVMLLAPLLGMPIPLTALQILWINLVTDGLPGLALSLEPPERNVMDRPPHPPQESILGRGMGRQILWVGLLMGLTSLGVGYWGWANNNAAWHTMVFTTLTLSQMGNALAVRSETDSLFKVGILSNKAMLGAVLLTLGLQFLVTYLAPLQSVFGTKALPPLELAISLLASSVVFVAIEISKVWVKRAKGHGEKG